MRRAGARGEMTEADAEEAMGCVPANRLIIKAMQKSSCQQKGAGGLHKLLEVRMLRGDEREVG